jgi:Arc/MetJ family transcription regulator
MKRTNLVLDDRLLEEATRLSGEKTYSAAVARALEEYVRRARSRQILELRGSGLWEGNLAEMREDHPLYSPDSKARKSRRPRRRDG